MADEDQDEQYMTMDEVLGELDVAEDELKKMVSEGKLRAFRSQNKMKFREEDVESLRQEPSGAEEEIEFPDEESDQQETIVDDDMEDLEPPGEEEETLELGDLEGDEEEEIDLGSLDEELVLDEEETEPGDTPETEEVIFEEDDLDVMADEEETTFDEGDTLVDGPSDTDDTIQSDEFDLGDDEESTLLDEEVDEDVGSGSTQVVDEGISDTQQPPSEPGTTAQQTQQTGDRTESTAQKTQQQPQQPQPQSGQRTAARRQRAPQRQKQSVNVLWTFVLVFGVLVMMETVLIGVDMARMSALQSNEPDPVQVDPWPTSRLATPLLDMFFDGKVSLKPKPVLKKNKGDTSDASSDENTSDSAGSKKKETKEGPASSSKK